MLPILRRAAKRAKAGAIACLTLPRKRGRGSAPPLPKHLCFARTDDLNSRMRSSSHLDWRDVDPAAFAPASQGALRQLHALGAFQQRVFVWRVFADVADEHFP